MTLEFQRDLDNSYAINPDLQIQSSEFGAVVEHVLTHIHQSLEIKVTKALRANLSILLSNLVHIHQNDPKACLAVPMTKSSYVFSKNVKQTGYSSLVIKVTQYLLDLGLINTQTGFFDRTTGQGRTTRFWMSDHLLNTINNFKNEPDQDLPNQGFKVTYNPEAQTVILRKKNEQKKNVDIDYEDTPFTQDTRFQMKMYNTLLNKSFIEIPCLTKPIIHLQDQKNKTVNYIHIDQTSKYVRRIFNEDFDHGGRFYGGWWQRIPSDYREHIAIDNIPCVEVDYSTLHPAILYAQQDINYQETIGHDLYTIPIDEFETDPVKARKVIKQVMLILINATDPKNAIGAIRQNLLSKGYKKNLKDTHINKIIDAVKTKHKPIEASFMSNAGLKLQRIDSEFASTIINQFTSEGIPILTLHDSFLVQCHHKWKLIESMQKAFLGHFPNSTISLDTDEITKGLEMDLDEDDLVFYQDQNHEIQTRQMELDFIMSNNPSYTQRYHNFLRS